MFAYGTLIASSLEARRVNKMSRKQLMSLQKQRLREIARYAMEECPFYENLYKKHGVKEEHIETLEVDDLPIVDKVKLMNHFESVVTDKRLEYKTLEKYIETNTDPSHNYLGKYKILHTSGTTGRVGIFPNSMKEVAWVLGRMIQRVAPVAPIHLIFKQKVAYYAATHGHFAGVTFLAAAPKASMKVKTYSILLPTSEVVADLNKFQPEELTGYASSMEYLAEEQMKGNLNIKPKKIVCGGDPLYDFRRKKIKKAFGVNPSNSYSMTEGFGVANQLPGDKHLSVFDDMYVVETEPNTRITNLFNRTLPILRYQNDDVIHLVKDPDYSKYPFTQIREIEGRDNDFLHLVNNKGEEDMLHPAPLVEFFVEGLEKVQFIRQPGNRIMVKVVGHGTDIKERAYEKLVALLKEKKAERSMKVEVVLVDDIPLDRRTGKYRLVTEEK